MPTLIDLLHLDRQTMGDNRLADELLAMFVLQLDTALQELPGAPEGRRAALAHSLKGTARSLGIFAVADCAAGLEDPPFDSELVAQLSMLATRLREEVDTRLSRAG